MSVVAASPRIRLVAATTLGLALLAGAVAARAGSRPRPAPPPGPPPGRIASLAPRGAGVALGRGQVARAARICAVHAAAAGWANNGAYGGSLVTATAVCIAESGGQVWALTGHALSRQGLCLTAAAGGGQPAVTLAACDGGARQSWAPYGLAGLRNTGGGQCLDDPGGSARSGTPLALAACAASQEQAWWLP